MPCLYSSHRISALAAGAAALALSAACSPVFNWREVAVDAQLGALLPCKPDRAERALPLAPGGAQARISMVGCAAGGATFAIAHWPDRAPGEAAANMAAWMEATRAQWAGAELQEQAAAVPGASPEPAARQWRLRREAASGEAEQVARAQVRWFARAGAQGRVTLYQATVLDASAADADAAATFFDGLKLK